MPGKADRSLCIEEVPANQASLPPCESPGVTNPPTHFYFGDCPIQDTYSATTSNSSLLRLGAVAHPGRGVCD